MSQKPYVLSPAGSYECLVAAIDAGADEVYFGLSGYNARQNAKNFTEEETRKALRKCRLRGVKSNITLNTLVTDREILPACRMAYDALCMGADAFIVQDLGLAAALKKAIPEITLHASTQCACHSRSGALELADMGFERVVLARELPESEIREIVSTGIETEIFIHGALCVCHSGMCLMSSVIGKRSGNRGLCAQPCRLPYNIGTVRATGNSPCDYPLSLKDLSLARQVEKLTELGVTSLKIEGRMKSPEYVSGVTEIWKTLITENRNATDHEYRRLEELFSRSGFTDGYFTGAYRKSNRNMYGVRTDSDKEQSKNLQQSVSGNNKRQIEMSCFLEENKQAVLNVSLGDFYHTEKSDFAVQSASSRPMTEEDINASLSKLGDTEFLCTGIQTEIIGNIFIPKSQLNALRRNAIAGLERQIMNAVGEHSFDESALVQSKGAKKQPSRCVRLFPESLASLEKMLEKYKAFNIESICIPLGLLDGTSYTGILKRASSESIPFGVRLPRVSFTCEEEGLLKLLCKAKLEGATYAVCENVGQIAAIKKSGLALYAGFPMNVFNSFTVEQLAQCGFSEVCLSAELLSAQMRDMEKHGIRTSVFAGGRLELMVLESCVMRASGDCRRSEDGSVCYTLCDRTGAVFPVKCSHRLDGKYPCRSIVLNSVPVHLIDKPDELNKTGADVYCIYE